MTDDNEVSSIALEGLEDSRRALLELLEGMRRTLYCYTPLVRPELYDDAEVVDAIRNRIVTQPKIRLQLLLPPAHEWRSACPRLIRLSERLTTALTLRTPNREETQDRPELGQAFMIADERVLLHFNDPRRLRGLYAPKPIDRTKEALELFREVWNKAQPDPQLRRLGV